MDGNLLFELERTFKKCSDCIMHPDYIANLNKMYNMDLASEHVDYLCERIVSQKHIWEIRFAHLKVLLLNPSAIKYDLKAFYLERIKKCRRLALKIFFIRGYAIYASEDELNPIIDKFRKSLDKNHDYLDYNYILSVAGLPYLVNTYGYKCFDKALEKAEVEYQKINPLLIGYFTLNERLEQVDHMSTEEMIQRIQVFWDNKRNT